MGGWAHGGGFSLDATVRIAGADLAGRERLLRSCARPPFALEHLHQHDADHVLFNIPKPRLDGPRALVLTPLELIDKVATLVRLTGVRYPPRPAAGRLKSLSLSNVNIHEFPARKMRSFASLASLERAMRAAATRIEFRARLGEYSR